MVIYFDLAHAIKVHDEIITKSGGLFGTPRPEIIESVLEHIQNDSYYPELEDKLTHLFYAINKSHAFADGNKRASVVLSSYFLELNGFGFRVSRFIAEVENIAVDVADNRIEKELLLEILKSLLYEEDYCEELKLKIYQAKDSFQ